ncbi:GGDEF domain-containing protein [Actinoplanes subtropicus]|uniref:GGDEF domain-containing protein n=1 Tax=Actinoplanes subtropicus TaxID=543632 RepID=UPI0004C2B7E5|nr:diguanylate cyclase [Actinoplanes subtropicus]
MTTKAAERDHAQVDEAALAATLLELETRGVSAFRTVRAPALEVQRAAREIGDEELLQRVNLLLADVMMREGRVGEGGRAAHQTLAWSREHDSPYVLARAHRELSIFYRLVGDISDSLTHGVQALAHLPEDVPPKIRARHLMTLAVALDDGGSPADGDRRYREALRIAEELDDQDFVLLVLNNMAYSAYENGDEAAARALTDRMRGVSAATGRRLDANELDTVARVEMMGGRYDSVEVALAGVLDGRVLANEGDAAAECLLTLAEARRLAGRHAAAQEALDRAIRQCDANGLARLRARARQEQAALHAAAGDYRAAYEEHLLFHNDSSALHSAQRESRARAMQAVFEANEARRASEHFREMAHRDALTGLYNRRYVNERLPVLLGEAAVDRTPISVAIADLDHFKRINDTLSHATGDTVLQRVGALLQEAASGPVIAARMGGEEFLLIFPGMDGAEAARRCELLRLRIRTHGWQPVTGALPVTTSIGVTTAPDGRATVSALLSQADRNLYAAKRAGRDRVVTDLA